MYLLKDGRYLCKDCTNKLPEEEGQIVLTLNRRGTPLLDDEEIYELLDALKEEWIKMNYV